MLIDGNYQLNNKTKNKNNSLRTASPTYTKKDTPNSFNHANQENHVVNQDEIHALVSNEKGMNIESDKPQIEAIRNALRLTGRDNVQIYVVPKGQRRIPLGSYINRNQTSPRLQELSQNMKRSKARIGELEIGISSPDLSEEERSRMINTLKQNIKDYERALSAEKNRLSALPISGWVVVEREE